MENNKTLYTVSVYTENRVGLLNQISIIFTRRQLNIETLTVSPSSMKGIHKFTITTYADQAEEMEKLVNQIEKKVDVLRAFYYTDEEVIHQEVALYKVSTAKLLENSAIESLVRKHAAQILEVNKTFTVIEKSGHMDETQALFEDLDAMGAVLQFVRSGRISITRSPVEHLNEYLTKQEIRRKESMK